MTITVIGVDCATEPKKVGLALGTYICKETVLEEIKLGSGENKPSEIIAEWIRQRRRTPVLLALDAPLGWPVNLSRVLANHCAGDELDDEANDVFRRCTDKFIKERVGKQPLDVGSNLIARTAHAALELLGDLRRQLNEQIPLAWSKNITGVAAIEVYPAATLTVHEIPSSNYKKKEQGPVRKEIVEAIGRRLRLSDDLATGIESMKQNSDTLDAAVCILAAHDFLLGETCGPKELETAKREGWIWVKAT